MCVLVRITAGTVPRWTRDDVAIDLPPGLTHGQARLLVRSILEGLGTPQPPHGAVCFCGEPVQVPGLMPQPEPGIMLPHQKSRLMAEASRGA